MFFGGLKDMIFFPEAYSDHDDAERSECRGNRIHFFPRRNISREIAAAPTELANPPSRLARLRNHIRHHAPYPAENHLFTFLAHTCSANAKLRTFDIRRRQQFPIPCGHWRTHV